MTDAKDNPVPTTEGALVKREVLAARLSDPWKVVLTILGATSPLTVVVPVFHLLFPRAFA